MKARNENWIFEKYVTPFWTDARGQFCVARYKDRDSEKRRIAVEYNKSSNPFVRKHKFNDIVFENKDDCVDWVNENGGEQDVYYDNVNATCSLLDALERNDD